MEGEPFHFFRFFFSSMDFTALRTHMARQATTVSVCVWPKKKKKKTALKNHKHVLVNKKCSNKRHHRAYTRQDVFERGKVVFF